MTFRHACFLSFPRDAGPASIFAQEFYEELVAQLKVYQKSGLSIYKFDLDRKVHDPNWQPRIAENLCHSAMMVAVCAPTYFNDSPACVSEFDGMETLIHQRQALLEVNEQTNWIIGLRLKANFHLPRLDNSCNHVVDFSDCCSDPRRVKNSAKLRKEVERLADDIYKHWQWLQNHPKLADLYQANLCANFQLPPNALGTADAYPQVGGVR